MKFKLFFSLLLCAPLLGFVSNVESAKILAVYAFPGKSHYGMHTALIRELVEAGHEVTMIASFSLKSQNFGSNYTEILIEPVYDFWSDIQHFFKTDNLFELTSMNLFGFLKMLEILGLKTTEHALKQPKVQAIINAEKTEGVYDLLLAEQFYQEAFLSLAYKYNIPVVTSSTLGYENHMSQMMGLLSPWSFVPHGFMPFSDHMTFFERLQNSFYSLYEDLDREWNYFPKMDALVQQHFSHLPVHIPKVTQMEKNISVMLLNSYMPLVTPRPTMNSMVPVGGMHINKPKPLPGDIQKFLDEAVHGAIFFSLGSNVESKDMPDDMLQLFLDVFASLKQRVLWKFENESIPNMPKNIMIKKWMPQNDILAHHNTKVFITHGGLFGTQEGVHHGIPMLGMPFYCDQHLNMNKAVQGKYAISLHFQSITRQLLKDTIMELIENPMYKRNAQYYSDLFRDRPLEARKNALYWIEYVIRHKGAPHLRSAGLDLAWYQFYLLDVIGFVIVCVLLIIWLSIKLLRILLKPNKARKQKAH